MRTWPGPAELRPEVPMLAVLVVVVAFGDAWWPTQALAASIGVAALFFPDLRYSRWPWFALAAVLAAGFGLEWWATDNHHLLIALSCLLFGLALTTDDTVGALALGSRRLIAAVFVAAVVAKLASPDFRSGTFGDVWPSLDDRLGDLAERVGALDGPDRSVNADALDLAATEGSARLIPVAGWFSGVFSVWTIAVEVAVAVGFLVHRRHRLAPLGDAALLAFVATTYAVVPVIGFAGVLGALGLAQAERPFWQRLYVVALVAIPLQEAASRVI